MATGDPDLLKTKRKELIATHQEVNKLLQAATMPVGRHGEHAKGFPSELPLVLFGGMSR